MARVRAESSLVFICSLGDNRTHVGFAALRELEQRRFLSDITDATPLSRPRRARRINVIRPPAFSPLQFRGYLVRLAQYFDLIVTLSRHRILVRYKQSALGLTWALVQPLGLTVTYTVIFSVVTHVQTGGVPYSIFVFAALLPWTFFSSAVTSATGGLVSHTNLITKVYFPREILPITYVFSAGFDFVIAGLVMTLMMIYYHMKVSIQLWWIIPILMVALAFSTAMSLLLSVTQVWFRDVGLAMPLVMQIWMFASPVVYPLNAVPARFRSFYILNPMVGIIENFRRVITERQPPDYRSLEVAAVVSFILLPLFYLLFKQREATMADVI
jgi:lipopolysaccharide transport system permease protein